MSQSRRPSHVLFASQGHSALGLILLGCIVPLGWLLSLPSANSQPPEPVPLPSFERVLVTPAQWQQELNRIRPSPFILMPLADFEDQVRQAQGATAKNIPQLLETRYRATLTGSHLIGTGQWKIQHRGPGSRILPLPSLNLAVRQPHWEQREAIIAAIDGQTPGLVVDQAGESTVGLDWTAQGDPGPDGLHFFLRVPPCAIAELELTLPRDRSVTVSAGCLISGPYPTDVKDSWTWKIAFSQFPKFHLTIQPHEESGTQPPLILAQHLHTIQRLHPDMLEAEFKLDFKVLRGQVETLQCQCDSILRPYEVNMAQLKKWELIQGPPGTPLTLRIQLREPLRGDAVQMYSLRIVCQAPLTRSASTPSANWTSPGLRLRRALPQGETLELHLHPNIRLDDWRPGGFRLLKAVTGANGWQVLTLAGGLLQDKHAANDARNKEKAAQDEDDPNQADNISIERPSAHIRIQGVEYRVRQLTWWRADLDRHSLTVQVDYDVLRGRLFELPLAIPSDWEVERLELNPASWLRSWDIRPEDGQAILRVELQRALTAASDPDGSRQDLLPAATSGVLRQRQPSPLRLTIYLRPRAEPGASTSSLSAEDQLLPQTRMFPDVVPLGAQMREGALAIDFDEQRYAATVSKAPALLAPLMEEGPWGKQPPDHYYPYQGQPIRGQLHLRPLPPRLRVHCNSSVILASGHAAVETRLQVLVVSGSTATLDFYLSSPISGSKWDWKILPDSSDERKGERQPTNAIRSFERMPSLEAASLVSVLGVDHPLALASMAALRPVGEWWRLVLTRPVSGHEKLLLQANYTPSRTESDNRWHVPLLAVPGSSRMEGEVTLYLPSTDLVQIENEGLREPQGSNTGTPLRSAPLWRTFRYSQLPLALILHGQTVRDNRTAAVLDRATLITYVDRRGYLLHHYCFQVWNWQQPTLPLRLPPGARLRAVRMDDANVDLLGPRETVDGPLQIELPVSARSYEAGNYSKILLHSYEVVYQTKTSPWWFWSSLDAPAPSLPLDPVVLQRIWRLPPGLTPLQDGRQWLQRGWEKSAAVVRYPLQTFPLTSISSFLLHPLSLENWELRQRQWMLDAALTLSQAGKRWTLGEALDRLAFQFVKENGPSLVLDAHALRAAGLNATTRLPAISSANQTSGTLFPWEHLGLVYVPCRPAPLLTTRQQMEAWRSDGSYARLSTVVEQAVAEALTRGHDRSGRFYAAVDWLREQRTSGDIASAFSSIPASNPDLVPEPREAGWTEWEPIAGTKPDEALQVVWRDGVTGLGLALALLLSWIFWRAPQSSYRRRLRLLLIWLALAGLGLLWLPEPLQELAWWPLVAASGIILGLYIYLVVLMRKSASTNSSTLRGRGQTLAGALVFALIVALSLVGQAAGPATPAAPPFTVFVLSSPGKDGPTKPMALVPQELSEQLQTRIQQSPDTPRGTVLVRARYTGKVRENQADFEAEFQVHSFSAGPSALILPLDNVRIQDNVLLDGVRAYPVLGPLPQAGYRFTIEKPGTHVIRLHFSVPLIKTGAECNLRFTVPRLVQSSLTLDLPAGAALAQVLVKQGAHTIVPVNDAVRLEVDLGCVDAPLHFRWRQEATPPQPPRIELEEGYLWNLNPGNSSLIAILKYQVTHGASTTFAIDIPETLGVRHVEVRSPVQDATPPRMQEWRLLDHGRFRRLQIHFQDPITGSLILRLELTPHQPLGTMVSIPLLMPQEVVSTRSFLAYRLTGVETKVDGLGALTPLGSTQPLVAFWKSARESSPLPVNGVYTIQRNSGEEPFLRLQLSLASRRVFGSQDILWRLGWHQAELRLLARLTVSTATPSVSRRGDKTNSSTARSTTPDHDLALVEWEVPENVLVSQIRGRDGQEFIVRHWTRTGTRVQAWLQRSMSHVELELVGWMPLAPANEKEPLFRLPCIRLLSVHMRNTWVHLAPDDSSLALTPLDTQALLPLPDLQSGGSECSYMARDAQYDGTFKIHTVAIQADARMLTFMAIRDRQLTFTTTVRCQVRQGELRKLRLQMENWENGKASLNAPHIIQSREERRGVSRFWTLELQPGIRDIYQLSLTGTMPLEEAMSGIAAPDITLSDGTHIHTERWLVISGPDLQAEAPYHLLPVTPASAASQETYPFGREQLDRVRRAGGLIWKIEDNDWNLRLRPLPRTTVNTAPVQVFLTEHAAEVVDGRRWVHEAVYWLYHEANTDLNISLPLGAQLLSVAVDGIAVAPLQPEPSSLWLPLPGSAGACCVRLRWRFTKRLEPVRQPRLEAAQLHGVADGPAIWTIQVPESYLPPSRTQSVEQVVYSSAAELDWRRAEAQYRLSSELADGLRPGDSLHLAQFSAAQRRFYQFCRYVEYGQALAMAGRTAGSNEQRLTEDLHKLREQNRQLAEKHGLEDVRAEAERQVRSGIFVSAPAYPPRPRTNSVDRLGMNIEQTSVPRADPLPAWGEPLYLQSQASSSVPHISLLSLQDQQRERSLGISLMLLVALLALGALSFFPEILVWLRALWPEQALCLGGFGWEMAGPAPLFLILVLIGVSARLIYLSRWLMKRLRPLSSGAGSSVSGNARSPEGQAPPA